eukprot:TRINITY_DN3723_c0_g1_i7.p1 TRINITY_DN3723_c0_g1~~TRINITY_DN3723_c0_g1_i7.p1  ORF type:complete len:869 (+),score=224.76 TRINITY_DN3723_c0_g1_i7:158-2764(+)
MLRSLVGSEMCIRDSNAEYGGCLPTPCTDPRVPSQRLPTMCNPDDGLLIPAMSSDDHCTWYGVLIYMIPLLWSFLGVALIADIFMGAIEEITSKETVTKLEVRKEVGSPIMVERDFTVKVWNDTVANLTLMALGSSAPEILLSVIEVLSNNFFSGELGPSTIVGSAAFNMFIIISVCILAIDEGDSRTIMDFNVFLITAVGSLIAYGWLAFILVGNSEDIVEPWEAVVTLGFFPVLVIVAFLADAKKWCFAESERTLSHKLLEVKGPDGQPLSTEDVLQLSKTVREKYGVGLTPEQNAELLAREAHRMQKRSRAFYRVQAIRGMTGGKKIKGDQGKPTLFTEQVELEMKTSDNPAVGSIPEASLIKLPELFELSFESPDLDVSNSASFEVTILRNSEHGEAGAQCYARCETPASEGEKKLSEELVGEIKFEDSEKSARIVIPLTEEMKSSSPFELVLKDPSSGYCTKGAECCLIVVQDDDYPGMFAFSESKLRVRENEGEAVLTVVRKHGAHGEVSCNWRTKDGTAVAPADYHEASGKLEFADGEVSKQIRIQIVNDDAYELEEHFSVIIDGAVGCSFDPTTDGFEDKCIATITIEDDDDMSSWIDAVLPLLDIDPDRVRLNNAAYAAQFVQALSVNGGDDDDDPTCLDWTLHILSLPWKLLFAVVPPTRCCGGWLTFYIALLFIGLLTALIGDLASLMGAAMGLEDSVTAITFVALGTSLPDTFASKTAAVGDPSADAAIGNVTGSNAVNVFLGLGLPWVVASFYWDSGAGDEKKWLEKYCGTSPSAVDTPLSACPNIGFAVPAGDLGISVGVFIGCATVCVGVICLRRKLHGAELGGPMFMRHLSAGIFVSLWFIYVGVSVYLVYK